MTLQQQHDCHELRAAWLASLQRSCVCCGAVCLSSSVQHARGGGGGVLEQREGEVTTAATTTGHLAVQLCFDGATSSFVPMMSCESRSPAPALLLLSRGEAWVDVVGINDDLSGSLDSIARDRVNVLIIVVVIVFLLLFLLVFCIDLDSRVVGCEGGGECELVAAGMGAYAMCSTSCWLRGWRRV
jgi:hypothetical protein